MRSQVVQSSTKTDTRGSRWMVSKPDLRASTEPAGSANHSVTTTSKASVTSSATISRHVPSNPLRTLRRECKSSARGIGRSGLRARLDSDLRREGVGDHTEESGLCCSRCSLSVFEVWITV